MTNTKEKEPVANPANPHARVPPTEQNPRGYPPFDMRNVPSYTTKQIQYYFTTGAIPAADQTRFQELMEQRKTSLALIGWDGASPQPEGGNNADHPEGSHTVGHDHIDSDSDCPAAPANFKGIKFSPSDIPKLQYNSTVAQYNNWLVKLKNAFAGDPAKYPTSRQKIILAQATLDEQLQMSFNSASQASPVLSEHWRKFEQWMRDFVLHQGSDKHKLSSDFTNARQSINEDPNQFYIRLFNLGMQSDRTVTIEDYRTRLFKPLRNLMDQHDREYLAVKDVVAHAGRLWQTLDRDKLRQEILHEKENKRKRYDTKQPNQSSSRNDRPRRRSRERRGSQKSGSRQDQAGQRDQKPQDSKPRLSAEEQQHRVDRNLCFNCGYPGHQSRDCTYSFNPNRAPLKDDKGPAKSQSTHGRYKKRARAHPIRAESPSDRDDPDVHTTDESDQSDESERPSKRRKN